MSLAYPEIAVPKAAPAKIRILKAATELFYREGIRAVGVDRLITESAVTKATFYKHYGSKDRLILEYVTAKHVSEREHLDELARLAPVAEDTLRALIESIADDIADRAFRGCAFFNAAAEFPDALDPVRVAIARHRDWYTGYLAGLLQNLGHPMPGDAADELMLARDGAMAGGYAGDPIAATAALQRVAERVIRAAKTQATAS